MNILPELSDAICRLLRCTGREGVEELILFMRTNGYFMASCHRHHYYVGGMAQHAFEVYLYMKTHIPTMSEDSLIIVSLLHDICDISGFREYPGHGRRSVGLLDECHFPLTNEERRLIRYHMFRVSARTPEEQREVAETHATLEWQVFKNADCHSASNPMTPEQTLDEIERLDL